MGSIWSVSVYYKENKTSFARIPIQGQEIISFCYNKKDKYLYWADAKRQTINRALLDGSKKDELFKYVTQISFTVCAVLSVTQVWLLQDPFVVIISFKYFFSLVLKSSSQMEWSWIPMQNIYTGRI